MYPTYSYLLSIEHFSHVVCSFSLHVALPSTAWRGVRTTERRLSPSVPGFSKPAELGLEIVTSFEVLGSVEANRSHWKHIVDFGFLRSQSFRRTISIRRLHRIIAEEKPRLSLQDPTVQHERRLLQAAHKQAPIKTPTAITIGHETRPQLANHNRISGTLSS